ncbi:uncharacterized protein VTP21DRAFT_8537 [Calcarisporiella thermophila]|uniref:uncharacterized protein n=1 Tax=Calcarisporiella thermophila TaxID=911321 RepID=UPI0037434489
MRGSETALGAGRCQASTQPVWRQGRGGGRKGERERAKKRGAIYIARPLSPFAPKWRCANAGSDWAPFPEQSHEKKNTNNNNNNNNKTNNNNYRTAQNKRPCGCFPLEPTAGVEAPRPAPARAMRAAAQRAGRTDANHASPGLAPSPHPRPLALRIMLHAAPETKITSLTPACVLRKKLRSPPSSAAWPRAMCVQGGRNAKAQSARQIGPSARRPLARARMPSTSPC